MKRHIYLSVILLVASTLWVQAEKVTTPWRGVNYSFNFCDGSIFPQSNPQAEPLDYGILRAYKGTATAVFYYNGTQHGVEFKAGNYIELDVAGSVTLKIGGCQYSGSTSTITVTDLAATYSATKFSKTPTCTSTLEFVYTGPKTTLKIAFGVGKTYIPKIDVISAPVTPDFGATYTYNLCDGSLLPQNTTTKYPIWATSDGILTINSNTTNTTNQMWWHDSQHGIVITNGTSIRIVVPGSSTISFGCCQYSVAGAVYNLTDSTGNTLGSISATDKGVGACTSHSYIYKGDATIITATLVATGSVYLSNVVVKNEKAKTKMIDVWDFGAEKLDTTKYNNMLNETIINSWYPSTVVPGTSGVNFPTTFTAGILTWKGGSNDRLRTSSTNLSRYDANSAPNTIADSTLTGSLYVNSAANLTRYFTISLSEDDELYMYIKSSGGSIINFVDTTHAGLQADTAKIATQRLVKFVAKNAGIYKIFDSAQKPFYYRILRKDATIVKATGPVDVTEAPGIAAGYTILFTNKAGKTWKGTVTGGTYTAKLPAGFEYNLSLENANGYLISNGTTVTINGDTTRSIALKKIVMYTVSGNIVGLTAADLTKLKLVYTPDPAANKIYVPETTVNSSQASYTANLEPNCSYTISAIGVNDYRIPSNNIIITGTKTADITFVPKPIYPVTITTEGLTENLLSKLNVVFTNKNEAGYVYTFSDLTNIKLRDGVYKISCTGLDSVPVQLALTSELKINGAGGSKNLVFKPVTIWPFDDAVITNANHAYKGLLFTGNVYNEIAKSHLVAKAKATIGVPMNPGEKLTITYYYDAGFSIDGQDTIRTTSGSTSKFETVSYIYPGTKSGLVTIGTDAGTTYITDMLITKIVPFAETITVGINRDYATINEALAAVSGMIRPNNQRVKIMIDPGNYEEMLVIDMDSISLINAFSSPGIELTNNGVDIHPNVVRITSYYGHGYNYFSMGNDQKWNADVLRVNKENGYTNYVNAGGASTSGSYWNSTVVVSGAGFHAENIIFENSFNQYISKKESEDVVVEWTTGGKGTRPTDMGNVAVQNKSFVERGAAIAFTKSADKALLYKCRVIGRQDSFYGAEGARVVTYKGSLMGGTDYIFGGMTLVAYQSDLAMNTSEASTDVSYITAAQQVASRGYLMYECTITSAQPGTETASQYLSKPGYLGRPWQGTTSEVVFFNTNIYNTNYPGLYGKSLIAKEGWLSTLGGTSDKVYEYGSIESSGENNASSRVSWAHMPATPVLTDGTEITTFNFTKGTDGWDPLQMLKSKDGLTGVDTRKISPVQIYAFNNRLCVTNIKSNTQIYVYSVDGSMSLSREIKSDESFELKNGLWIVKANSAEGNKVVKVLVN